MALGIELITPVPHLIARALVGGLSHDSIVTHKNAHEIYPEVNLLDFESATKDALTRLHPLKIERVWADGEGQTKSLKHEGFFIDHRKIKVDAEPEKVFNIISKFAKHFGAPRFVVDTIEPDHLLLLRSQSKTPGARLDRMARRSACQRDHPNPNRFLRPARTRQDFYIGILLYPFRSHHLSLVDKKYRPQLGGKITHNINNGQQAAKPV